MNFSFQAMGKALAALVVSISRQGFVFMPLLFISSAVAGLNGIIYAQPLADLISIVISVLMFIFIMNRIKKNENEVMPVQFKD